METIFGHIEKITFQNSDTGFTVAQLLEPKRKETTCIVGTLSSIRPGETIRCYGCWKQHLIHGKQFIVEEYKIEAPADLIGIQKYLSSGLIKGIGNKYAEKIVNKFGIDTLHIIDTTPEKLLEIEKLGKKRVEKISSCWNEQKSIREIMIFLQSHHITPSFAQKIFKRYGKNSIQQVKENPYRLAKEIRGIGFKSADSIAKKIGIKQEAPERIDAGIEFVLSELSTEGHTCHPIDLFLTESETILEVPSELISSRIELLKHENRIELFNLVNQGKITSFIWMKALFLSEVGIAREIKRLLKSESSLRQIEKNKALEWVQKTLNIQLAENQQKAVISALTDKFHIITGGPGTGKSTITNAILTISNKLTSKILLAAPTGRAAKRMAEITGYKASTIHSLLEFDFMSGKFKRNQDSPLECDLIIIDESSMIDTYLMYSLLKAIPNSSRVILVGDINQLPSVGPGNVLKDIIQSSCCSVSMLTEIFRQATGSRIITNAHAINQGYMPDLRTDPNSDFFFINALEPEKVIQEILSLVSVRIPLKYGFDPINEIQVLAPMKRGSIGTENLNTALQEKLNPKGLSLSWNGQRYQVGDKVMQVRNNYQKEVYNGDIGRITSIDLEEQQMIVTIDEKEVLYEFSDLDELILSYAVSIHKYQGSECPCIIIPIHTAHFKLLTRNLLYTGVTRGKKIVILVGSTKAIGIAIRNNDVEERYTGLESALRGIIC